MPEYPDPAERSRRIVRRLILSRGLRAFADGFVSVLLPVYLLSLGYDSLDVGLISTSTLLGSGTVTLLVGLHAHRFETRRLLLGAALLMACTGIVFVNVTHFLPLLCVAFVGTLNPSRGDVSMFLPLEHSIVARHVSDQDRTAAFARYGMAGSLVAALGSAFAGFPQFLSAWLTIDMRTALQSMFALYSLIGLCAAGIYATLPRERSEMPHHPSTPSKHARPMVYKLAALFSIDAFGGGLVVDSMVVLWLYQRFEISPAVAGSIFLWVGLLSAASYPVAVWLARKIGLVNTMVFTHLPSNVALALVPLMPNATAAIAMFLVRSALSQMDVPTRNSFVMAIVPPEERAAAASVTVVPRSFAAAAAPAIAGYLLTLSSFGLNFIVAGVVKGAYDLLLLYTCRNVRLPEEQR